MKVLVSAYACEPGQGSEPGTGWEWTRAAARAGHEVWVVTRENNQQPIDAALQLEPELGITPVYLDLPPHLRRWKKGPRGLRRYYVLWQHAARKEMVKLHRQVRFDVAHHLTFATDWMPSAATAISGLPSVWGPVGGSTPMALPLYRFLGIRGAAEAVAREAIGRAGRATWGKAAAKRAAITIALNADVARRFAHVSRSVVVEPNSAFDTAAVRTHAADRGSRLQDTHPNGRRSALFVGRLMPWKGLMLALKALTDPLAALWDLDVYGDGPDRPRLERAVIQHGLTGRVRFKGQVPRSDVLSAMRQADALLHPAFHDSAPWTVGEAVTLGVPVVCLDTGGPPTLAAPGCMEAVAVDRHVVSGVAEALQRLETVQQHAGSDHWSRERLPEFLTRIYSNAAAQPAAVRRADGA